MNTYVSRLKELSSQLGNATTEETKMMFTLRFANVLPEETWGISWMHSHSSDLTNHERIKQQQKIEWDVAYGIPELLNSVPTLLDTIDQQAALLAKYREALEWYADIESYLIDAYNYEEEPSVMLDNGKRARTALEQTP